MNQGCAVTATSRALSWRLFVAVAPVFISIMATPITARSDQGPWTRQDLDKVADAAVAAAAASNTTSHSFMLLELADALTRAGSTERAKAIVLQAGKILGPSNDFMHSSLAARVVATLARVGDIPDAEALVDAATSDDTRATLLGKIGEAQARAGDVTGALRTMEKIGPLPEMTQKPVPAAANPKILALAGIGGAFDNGRATEIVLKMADGLPNGYQRINLLSRVGKTLCASDDPAQVAKGRLVAEQAAHAASTPLGADLMPYEKRNWVVAAAGVLGTCDGPDVALSFLRNTLPAQQITMAASMIADNSAQNGEAGLARAMAPPVDPDDLDSLLDSAKRSLRLGDQEAAKATAMQASATAARLYGVRLPPDKFPVVSEICGLLIKLQSHDAAIESTSPIDPINRAQFYVSIVQGEISNDNAAAVERTVPMAVEALKATPSQPMLIRMTLILARSGYHNDAEIAYEALSAARNTFLAANPGKHGPDAFAGVQAAMGDLPGALAEADQAGPLVTKPNGLVETVMSFANVTTPPTKAEVESKMRQV